MYSHANNSLDENKIIIHEKSLNSSNEVKLIFDYTGEETLNIIGLKYITCSISDSMYLLKNKLSKHVKKINLIDINHLVNRNIAEMFYKNKFNWQEYLNKYEDLLKNNIDDREKAWLHAKVHGAKENRDIFQEDIDLLNNFKIFIDNNKCVYENEHNLFCVQPFELKDVDFTKFKHKPSIFWVWEFKSLPDIFKEYEHNFCKIYTMSNYCKTIFKKHLSVPVEKIDITSKIHEYKIESIFEHTIQNKKIEHIIKETKDKIKIGYCFDLNSSIIRKNPLNLIKAFLKINNSNKVLILKYRLIRSDNIICNYEKNLINEFNTLVKECKNIYCIDEELSQIDLYKLYTYFDYYISTHLGEGFGITIYDNMILGNKIISPFYSGETDYLNKNNSILLDYVEKKMKDLKNHENYGKIKNYNACFVSEENIYNCLVEL